MSSAADTVSAVRLTGVSKSFGGVRALNDVNLEVKAGEIHALLGGNGAGKSTVLKILRGVHKPDAGRVEVFGQMLSEHTPDESTRAGIAMIFQEMSLVPTLTVAQNIFLNQEIKSELGLLDDRQAIEKSRALFKALDVDVDPEALAGDLGAGQRQLTEIVKAISRKARVLILDEPSTALSAHDVERLFAFLRKLKAEGVGIIYVSHRMDEIMRIADRATIFRDGRHVLTAPLSELSLEKIIEVVVGGQSRGLSGIERDNTRQDRVLLEMRHVSGALKPIDASLKLHAGEVIGIAGLLGSGRSAIARLLFGLDQKKSGEILIDGKVVEINSPKEAIALGLALIPEDRLRQGVIIEHSVADNLALSVIDRISRWGFTKGKAFQGLADKHISELKVKTPSAQAPVRTLSGGNQQKVVLGKWLASDPRVIILDEPTAGIDIGSKSEIIMLVRQLARQGKAVIIISSELNELLSACDRIVVMADGRITRDIERTELDPPGEKTNDLQFAERSLQKLLQEMPADV